MPLRDWGFFALVPTACAVGCVLALLRNWDVRPLFEYSTTRSCYGGPDARPAPILPIRLREVGKRPLLHGKMSHHEQSSRVFLFHFY
jgi:hypothetical protein